MVALSEKPHGLGRQEVEKGRRGGVKKMRRRRRDGCSRWPILSRATSNSLYNVFFLCIYLFFCLLYTSTHFQALFCSFPVCGVFFFILFHSLIALFIFVFPSFLSLR